MPQKLARSEQARVNGANSKGPTSIAGKARSSQNALTHGFAAVINTVIAIEDEAAFNQHLVGIRASFLPKNYMEETFVDQIASITWRQARLVGLESALLDAQISLQNQNICDQHPECADDDYFHLVQAWQALARPPQRQDSSRELKDPSLLPDGFNINSLELLRRYQTSLDRQLRNTLLNLEQYRKNFAPPTQAQTTTQQNEPSFAPATQPPSVTDLPDTLPSNAPYLCPSSVNNRTILKSFDSDPMSKIGV